MTYEKKLRIIVTALALLALSVCASTALAGRESHAGRYAKLWRKSGVEALEKLRLDLKTGKPTQREQILELFMEEKIVQLVPDVIEAILDDTALPRDGDSGWGKVHRQAAAAMQLFAHHFAREPRQERGTDAYSFFHDGDGGTEARRQAVRDHWLRWWQENEEEIARAAAERR